MATVNEQQLQRFKSMGIPVPLNPISPEEVQIPVKNKEVAARLAALKSGKNRALIAKVDEIAERNPMNIIAEPLQKPNKKGQQNISEQGSSKIAAPALASFTPTNARMDSEFLEVTSFIEKETVSKPQTAKGNPRHFTENTLPDPTGKQFLTGFRSALKDRLDQKVAEVESQEQMELPNGYALVNEEDLRNKIVEIASEVSKSMMTKVLNEYTAASKKPFVESANVKQLKIVGKNIVEINGKRYNVTPVK